MNRYFFPAVTVALVAALVYHAVLTYGQLDEMRHVYLRDRAAAIAARLEGETPDQIRTRQTLLGDESSLVDIRLFDVAGGDEVVEAILTGRELFRTEDIQADGRAIFRAYLPVHVAQQLNVARIDLASTAADFLLARARRNLFVASLSALALLCSMGFAIFAGERAKRLARVRLHTEHLAHLGEMSAVLAHEIRNPLGTIKGFIQLAAERAGPEAAALLNPALAETGRLEKLVNDLLLYGKTREPVFQEIQWKDFAADLQSSVPQLEGRDTAFRISGEASFVADPDLLREAILNLIRNSIEAGAAEIRISASRSGPGRLCIAVEDNGPGIADAVQSRLFEPFVTTKASGTGLGLSIARKLVQVLGGDLIFRPVVPHGARAEMVFSNGTHPHR